MLRFPGSVLLLLLGLFWMVGGFSSGPPNIADIRSAPGVLGNITYGELVCSYLSPGHFTDLPQPQEGNGGYFVNSTKLIDMLGGSYAPGVRYRVDLVGMIDQFKGFVLQAQDTRTGNLIGSFTPLDTDKSHVLNCDPSFTNHQATVSHRNSAPVTQQSFLWQAPQQQANPGSTVTFIYSVVREFPQYWVRLNATEHRPSPGTSHTVSVPHEQHLQDEGDAGVSDDSGTQLPCPTGPVHNSTFRLTFALPSGCHRSECTYFVGININSEDGRFLDFVVEGRAAAWVAIGLTLTSNMFDADVLGCNRYFSQGRVVAIDTWNVSPPQRRNILDSTQDDLCQHSASYEDGRIRCAFSRRIVGGNKGQDYDLNREYYFLLGAGDTLAAFTSQGFTMHQSTPTITATIINPVQHTGKPVFSQLHKGLTKAHGVLMILAWPVLAGTAIMFPAFLKPVLKKGGWFLVHRALMITSLFLGAFSFILIFVVHRNGTPPGLIDLIKPVPIAHFILGISVMVLQFANPIIALFRCKPQKKFRWIFNILHGKMIGYSAMLLALANICIGIFLFLGVNSVAFGLHLVSSAYFIALFLVLSLFLSFIPWLLHTKKKGDGSKALLSNQDSDTEEEGVEGKKGERKDVKKLEIQDPDQGESRKREDDNDSKFRYGAVVLYLMVIVPLTIAVIVLICIKK